MIRVLLAERAPMISAGFSALLSREDDMEIVAEVEDVEGIVPTTLAHRPDIVLIDINGDDATLAAAQEISRRVPECSIILLTGAQSRETLRRAFRIEGCGILSKGSAASDVVTALRRSATGDRVIDSRLSDAARHAETSPLTPRETDVLRLTAAGIPVPEIAATFVLSTRTVRNYLSTINSKLGARNQLDAVRIAKDAGWL